MMSEWMNDDMNGWFEEYGNYYIIDIRSWNTNSDVKQQMMNVFSILNQLFMYKDTPGYCDFSYPYWLGGNGDPIESQSFCKVLATWLRGFVLDNCEIDDDIYGEIPSEMIAMSPEQLSTFIRTKCAGSRADEYNESEEIYDILRLVDVLEKDSQELDKQIDGEILYFSVGCVFGIFLHGQDRYECECLCNVIKLRLYDIVTVGGLFYYCWSFVCIISDIQRNRKINCSVIVKVIKQGSRLGYRDGEKNREIRQFCNR